MIAEEDARKRITDFEHKQLFVFVHGYEGSPGDLRPLQNYISLEYPDALFMQSQSNTDLTLDTIDAMGDRLAVVSACTQLRQ